MFNILRKPSYNTSISPIWGWFLLFVYLFIPFITLPFPQIRDILTGTIVNMIFSILIAIVLFGWKKTITFYGATFIITIVMENISIYTGFPYGVFNHFTGGPRIMEVPIIVGFGYFNYAVIAWVFADLLIGSKLNKSKWESMLGRPIIGMIVASAMDAIGDPIGVMIMRRWEYPNGGGYFAVPLSNSFGWFLSVLIMLVIFELMLKEGNSNKTNAFQTRLSQWNLQVPILLGMQTIPLLIGYIYYPKNEFIDVNGKLWYTSDMYETLALVAIHTVLLFMIIGIFSYFRRRREDNILLID